MISRRMMQRILTAGALALAIFSQGVAAEVARPKYKILCLMSYHAGFAWADGQLRGFKEALGGGADVDYRVFYMEISQNNSPEWAEAKAREARKLIASWQPNLIYATDDDVQAQVVRHYVNKPMPIVFSGVNEDPAAYGYVGSKNVAGVIEREHFVESVRLVEAIVPGIKRVAVVTDEMRTWVAMGTRIKAQLSELPHIQIVAWDVVETFEEFKRRARSYVGKADAMLLLGASAFKDAQGKSVPRPVVLRWTAENIQLPDIAMFGERPRFGTLAGVTVSSYEQGLAAGRLARSILIDGKAPSSLPMEPTVKGTPMINLARAKQLGIKVKSGLLLSTQVFDDFHWDR